MRAIQKIIVFHKKIKITAISIEISPKNDILSNLRKRRMLLDIRLLR